MESIQFLSILKLNTSQNREQKSLLIDPPCDFLNFPLSDVIHQHASYNSVRFAIDGVVTRFEE